MRKSLPGGESLISVIIVIAILLIWAALMPPFFTAGACDAEFDVVASQIAQNKPLLASPELAAAYFWRSANLPVRIISAEQCQRSRPRFVDGCGAGDLLYVTIPIRNTVCRIYRDSEIRVQLQYDEKGRLRRLQTDMHPFKYLRLPWLGINWYWGR
jgi:hypothetical protein